MSTGIGRRSLGTVLGVGAAMAGTLLLVVVLVGAQALAGLDRDRKELRVRLDPAVLDAQQLRVALLDQETAVRGYALRADPGFLEPYARGRAQEHEAAVRLRALLASDPRAVADVDAVVDAAARWRAVYAEPVLAGAAGAPVPGPEVGKAAFDRVRAAVAIQQDHLAGLRDAAVRGVGDAVRLLWWVGAALAVVVAAGLGALLWLLRRVVVVPARHLADEVRQVAGGDLDRAIAVQGPQEITALGRDVDAMRRAMLAELADARAARRDLERSNADLEQFAYVASHDLQEPLRKVASFCQLLDRRYRGQLDERADQYIGFAVDGAKRMQVLINDLLGFSRVGRTGGIGEVVDTGALLDLATENVATALDEARGRVVRGDLPRVPGEPALLTTVFQNVLGNAVKFRGDAPPEVRVDAARDGDRWLLRFADNGIGIDPEYAERIFALFQRLHAKADYPGTGIGLAMCRRIVDHHGGMMWLEPSDGPGSTFVITLPALPDESPGPPEIEAPRARSR